MFRSGPAAFAFDDAYFEALNRARPLATVAGLQLYEGAQLERHAAKADDIGFFQFRAKAYEALLLRDVLARHRLPRRFARALDIGSGPALQSRLLRACGMVREAEALDIYDGRARCGEGRFWAFTLGMLAQYGALRVLPDLPRLRKWPVAVEEFSVRPSDCALTFLPRPGPTLARYHVGDVFAAEGQYDLVTSFMALDYFDFANIARKVSTLLAPDGVFAFLVSYWWYPVNNSLLFGRFPYLLQRLAPEEALRYYREVHPELPFAGVERRLGYSDQKRLTVTEYQESALAAGLIPVTAVRLHPDPWRNARAVLGPLAIDQRPGAALAQVLADARRWKPVLQLEDLLTSHVLLAFRKPTHD
jgi:SAM-dependent methyltransferase